MLPVAVSRQSDILDNKSGGDGEKMKRGVTVLLNDVVVPVKAEAMAICGNLGSRNIHT